MLGKLLNHCRTIKMTVGTIVYNCDNLIINYRSWAQSCDFYTQCSTNLMVFWSVKKMSQEIRCRSPMFRSPRLDVSGLKIMKHSLHCLVRMSTGRMWSIVIIRDWSSLFLARFLVTGDNMMLHLGQFTKVGVKVLGQPEPVRVSFALHTLIRLTMDLSGIFSFSYK